MCKIAAFGTMNRLGGSYKLTEVLILELPFINSIYVCHMCVPVVFAGPSQPSVDCNILKKMTIHCYLM